MRLPNANDAGSESLLTPVRLDGSGAQKFLDLCDHSMGCVEYHPAQENAYDSNEALEENQFKTQSDCGMERLAIVLC